MNVDIYSTAQRRTFLAVPAGAMPPAKATTLFKRLTLTPGVPRICLNPDEVILAIEQRGWAVIGL